MNKASVLAIFLLLAGCGRKAPIQVYETHGPFVPEHVRIFWEGRKAFEEATPEGYARAAGSFRRAAAMEEPSYCQYTLYLAEALIFLAQEQKLNWEEFGPRGDEANKIIDSFEQSMTCPAYEAFFRRLRAITWSPDYQSPGPRATTVQFQIRRASDKDPIAMLNRAIELDPEDPMNLIALWKISPADSRAPLLKAQELAPNLPLVQSELGNFQLIVGKYAEAKQSFERALESSPRHFHSVIGLAYSLGAVDPNADAGPVYRKAVEIAPSYLEARSLLGSYYAGMEETEMATDEYQAAISANPKYDPAYLALGVLLLRSDRLDEAEQSFLKVIELRPSTAEAHYYLGNIRLGRGDLEQAKARYQQALSYRVNFPEPIYAMGSIFYREGKVNEALAQYDRAIRVSQDFTDAYVSRGGIRFERQQYPAAIADYNRAIQIYEAQIKKLEADAQKSEAQNFFRKAVAARREKARVENQLQRARDLKKKAEDQQGVAG